MTLWMVAGSPAEEWNFRHDVVPILSKLGCNTGGCHGALAGKGGFRLSLNAYDLESDHYQITRAMLGRRLEFGDPARSLVLVKPTAAVRHKGGKVLQEESPEYRILLEWIQQGAQGPTDADPDLQRLVVSPSQSLLKKGDSQPLQVEAFFSDGSKRDVTRWARFSSTNTSVVEVDEKTGDATVTGHGLGEVTAWYSGQIAIARIGSPWPNQIPDTVYAEAPRRNVIDERVLDQLRQLNLKPSPPCTDTEFIRRAYLDVIGILPTPEEATAFLDDPAHDKRDQLVEKLLERPEFVDYWTYRWSDLFLISGKKLRPDGLKAYYLWLRGQIEQNAPWDELVRQVITAKGSSIENGASNFYAVHQEPETMAENVSQAFMSLSINCAKCHNHPMEKWTNDQYYAFANLFARVRAKGWGGDFRNGNGVRTLFLAPRGDLLQPRNGKPQPPAPLDAPPIPLDATADRREVLATWLTSPDNPYFTRSIANRVWANFFGRGIVHPVDDLRVSNPASNEPLLDAISEHLVANHHDLKSLMRLILKSDTYRCSSVPLLENRQDDRYFSRYYPRRLMAEVLHDAITSVTQAPGKFDTITLFDGSLQGTGLYPKGTRALQLYDSAITSYFLSVFGRNEREIACECERSNKPSMVQVLHLSNGNTLNDKLRGADSRVTGLLDQADDKMIDQAYLLCLSRQPGEQEREPIRQLLAAASTKKVPAAQFVRITNHGTKQILSLAEVQVISGETNIALQGTATQHSTDFGGPPEYAIDGNTDGTFTNQSVTHTAIVDNPWWELDLAAPQTIDKIILWNRLEAPERLSNFTVQLLDSDRQVVMTRHVESHPSPSLELATDNVREQKREVMEDLFWALMTSREFLFQH